MTQDDTQKLTQKEEAFIEALIGKAKGDPYKAFELAGYGPNYSVRQVLKRLQGHLPKETAAYIELNSIKAAHKIIEILDNPTKLGAANQISAANSILDRAGVIKKDKLEVEVTAPTALLVLPAKVSPPEDTK
jgi:hypothetical protein